MKINFEPKGASAGAAAGGTAAATAASTASAAAGSTAFASNATASEFNVNWELVMTFGKIL